MRIQVEANTLRFFVLSAIWGTTWIGIKAGIETVPPLLFAGTRFMAAGVVLLIFASLRHESSRLKMNDVGRFLIVSFLMISACYGPLFWGMRYINTGTAAVLEMSLTPIALLCFALLLREEAWSAKRFLALGMGVCGLLILFGPEAWTQQEESDAVSIWMRIVGATAVASAAFTYGLGSVLARPLLRSYPPFLVAGVTTLAGGTGLLLYALAFESGARGALSGNWGWPAWAGWLFLVIFGSLIGYTIYMRLLRDIGASRAGSYAFVSPVVAVLLGVAFFDEVVDWTDVVGMMVMLIGAYFAMAQPASSGTAKADNALLKPRCS